MKHFLTLLLLSGLLLTGRTQTRAYTPSAEILTMTQSLKTQLDGITSGNYQDKWEYYTQVKELLQQFSGDERLDYILKELGAALYMPILTEKAKVKQSSKAFKQSFVTTHLTGVQTISDQENCTGRYNLLDTMSFINNIPTALTIATRYKESSCGYYLPANGDGPFQIVSKDYGTGTINEQIFMDAIQDFIDFSKAKRTQYKTKLGINLTYTGFDFTGIVYHAALYNGATISGNDTSGYVATPNAPRYVYDGYGSGFSGATRYGIVPKFLKVLEWELNTTY